jgi:triphosphoribosyl-dephospho-CoA synthase
MEPGGLGDVDDQDVSTVPTVKLLECMQLAAGRDTIARQYANGFADVFRFVDELDLAEFERSWKNAVVRLQMKILAAIPDTLIARKCGTEVAEEASRKAGEVLAADCDAEAMAAFDRWLRADGHRRNPGTTADLVAAVLFVALREARLAVPAELTIVARG